MLIYILNLLIIIVAGVASLYQTRTRVTNSNNAFIYRGGYCISLEVFTMIILFFHLFLLYALRSTSVGGDINNYYNSYFLSLENMSWKTALSGNYEKGYIFLNKIISLIFRNIHFLLVLIGAFNVIAVYSYIKKYSDLPWMSIFLFVVLNFYNSYMNNLRSCIAISIMLFSINALLKNKNTKFFILLVIAAIFHKTIILFGIFYFFYKIAKNYKKLFTFLLTIGILLIIFAGKYIITYVSVIYYNQDITAGHEGSGYSYFILLVFLTVACYIATTSKIRKNSITELHFCMMLFAIVLQLFAFHFEFFVRATNYFAIALIILIPNVLCNSKIKKLKYIGSLFILIGGTLFYFYYLTNDPAGTVPYTFLWEN